MVFDMTTDEEFVRQYVKLIEDGGDKKYCPKCRELSVTQFVAEDKDFCSFTRYTMHCKNCKDMTGDSDE